ncbi:MAG TPA: xanthine dehydrogenase family protein molybdopterin-binding subunit [Candidatus Dormibacteraeota bacterium]|nr:xanthine dehydrogenase family protein molybdopterin-binding subunit [Candidatus Dormibacteraeota bacterium]
MPPRIGRRTRRVEDARLITGQGRFAGDIKLDGLAHVAFCRSALPHARIRAIDRSVALAMPGVIAVWTADEMPEVAGGLSDFAPAGMEHRGRPILNRDEMNYVGEAFAMVVAETAYQAQDAAEQVSPELDPLPGVGDVVSATAPGAPTVHANMKSNIALSASTKFGDITAAFASDSVTAKIRLTTSRVAGAAMEPRTVTATPDSETAGIKMWTSTQNVFGVRQAVASTLGLEGDKVRVLAEDVGGGFGAKGSVFPEEVLVALAAWRLKRPARWVASRSEDGATTAQGHGSVIELELAADQNGKLRGLRGKLIHDVGAYGGSGADQPGIIVAHMISAYALPAMNVDHQLVYTNSVPSGFIRGGGRPLGNFGMERVMDRLARELKLEPAELRRRNLIQPDQIPYDTHVPAGRRTFVYDSGDYPRLLELALEKLGPARVDHQDGRLIGVGVACCVESTGFGRAEPAKIRVTKDGIAHVYVGSTPQGQGHETMVALVAAERLGWPFEKIRVTAADTRHVPFALLTAGSRSAVQVGNATAQAASAMRRRLLEQAGEVLEADVQDLVLDEGMIGVRGTPARQVPATEVIPGEGLEVFESFDPKRPLAFSSGCHAAVVAVDPETGHVEVLKYVIAHDTGKAINPLTLEGQLHGGYAHGLGYALYEAAIYDADGSYRTASFLDYTIVTAGEVVTTPELVHIETPTDANPEGFKGAGESGTVPVPAAISNAVEDALLLRNPNAVVDRLPITPDRIVELLSTKTGR